MNLKRLTALFLFVGFAIAGRVSGQEGEAPVPVIWSLKSNVTSPLQPSEKFVAEVSAVIAPGWHIYPMGYSGPGATPTSIKVPDKQSFGSAGEIQAPEPASGSGVQFYVDFASFRVPLKVLADTPAGRKELILTVRCQACNMERCLPPATVTLKQRLEIKEAPCN